MFFTRRLLKAQEKEIEEMKSYYEKLMLYHCMIVEATQFMSKAQAKKFNNLHKAGYEEANIARLSILIEEYLSKLPK